MEDYQKMMYTYSYVSISVKSYFWCIEAKITEKVMPQRMVEDMVSENKWRKVLSTLVIEADFQLYKEELCLIAHMYHCISDTLEC